MTAPRQPRMWDDPPAPPGFEAFWQAYPAARRADKRRCALLWASRGLEGQADSIVAWLRAMTGCDQWRRGIVPLAYTTLHQARWLSGLPPDVAGPRAEWARSQRLLQEQQQHAPTAGPALDAAVERLRQQRERLGRQVAARQLQAAVREGRR